MFCAEQHKKIMSFRTKRQNPLRSRLRARGRACPCPPRPETELIVQGSDPVPVWPDPQGEARGASLKPLYRGAPTAARAAREVAHYGDRMLTQ